MGGALAFPTSTLTPVPPVSPLSTSPSRERAPVSHTHGQGQNQETDVDAMCVPSSVSQTFVQSCVTTTVRDTG